MDFDEIDPNFEDLSEFIDIDHYFELHPELA